MGSSDSSVAFTKHCNFRFPFTKFPQWKKNFNSLEDCKRHMEQFFAQNDKFWDGGITKLPEKWQKVVKQRGEYVT